MSIIFNSGKLTLTTCLLGKCHLVLVANNESLVLTQTGTGGDEVTADNVLLHTLEGIDTAIDSGLVEDLGGLLEGGCRHEAAGLQCSAGDTQQDLLAGCGHGVAYDDELHVTALERRVDVAQLAGGENLTVLDLVAVALVGDNLLAPDAVVLFHGRSLP